ncbi:MULTISPECIES: HK97-gp10 family putative phage morphogenesis protein [Clostridium]|uniref:Phage protein, HK97 gp10 family n=1 Tax=Clostridium coskatii TaxID=1705578 RepID=A0A162LJ17_9CLOT|nr:MULTISPECIES: HK97-gp10 family putative phage morphogenesis protein [Clostridium]OAA94086.1 hypothetical protein WX73_03656 [Clostridium coskatii]OBR96648.1 hypothetical protein CLCOS_08100 [Clostridium coskatii]QXE20448.1 hypothetical protein B5S50_17275 [Clostridium sp. 001]
MSVDVELTGISELIEKLQATNAKFNSVENKALKAGARPILDDMKTTKAFKDRSGDLRDDLSIGSIRSKNGIKSIQIGIDKNDISAVYYGKFIEFGSSHEVAKPFIQPAYERHKKEAVEIIKEEIRQALK